MNGSATGKRKILVDSLIVIAFSIGLFFLLAGFGIYRPGLVVWMLVIGTILIMCAIPSCGMTFPFGAILMVVGMAAVLSTWAICWILGMDPPKFGIREALDDWFIPWF